MCGVLCVWYVLCVRCVVCCVCVRCAVCVWCGAANEAAVMRRAVRQYNRICNNWTSSLRCYGRLMWYDAVSTGTYLTAFRGESRCLHRGESSSYRLWELQISRWTSRPVSSVPTKDNVLRTREGRWSVTVRNCVTVRSGDKHSIRNCTKGTFLWNVECQVSFAPSCIVLLTSRWKPSIFFTPEVFSWFRTGTPLFIETLTSVNFAFFVAISVMKQRYNLTPRRGQCWLTPRCSSLTQRGHAQFYNVFVLPCLCIPSHPPFV